jgi:hypothetical protein
MPPFNVQELAEELFLRSSGQLEIEAVVRFPSVAASAIVRKLRPLRRGT